MSHLFGTFYFTTLPFLLTMQKGQKIILIYSIKKLTEVSAFKSKAYNQFIGVLLLFLGYSLLCVFSFTNLSID